MTADTEANGRRDRFRAIAMAYGGHEKEPSHSSLQEPRAPGLRRAAAREDIMTEEATGRGVRAADSTPRPLSPEQLDLIHAYWRAANYLSVGQIYLMDNPLLAEPLRPEHIKPRLLGHWGTTPGLNFIYAHLNRVIRNWDLNAIYVTGPGHGGPGIVANTYLEGTYSEVYPDITQDAEGMRKLFRQFSFPGGIPSHVAPETPGSINEGGELGYSLLHAFGAAFDNPELLVCCVIGDGEAETGPLAASWHASKFLDPIRDGAVLPILHLNGYKIASPTVLARIPQDELRTLLEGYGYAPHFVDGDDPPQVHQRMAAVLDEVVERIQTIQKEARERDDPARPRWQMIVLRTPKGWTGPKKVDDQPVEGTFRAHQVPISAARDIPEHLALLESWLRSYRPEELFDDQGTLVQELRDLPPKRHRRMSANPHANGGLLLHDLDLPDFRSYAVEVAEPGAARGEATRVLGAFLRDIVARNRETFRLFGPDETASNRLSAVFEATDRAFDGQIVPGDDHLAPDGRVMEVLSEHLHAPSVGREMVATGDDLPVEGAIGSLEDGREPVGGCLVRPEQAERLAVAGDNVAQEGAQHSGGLTAGCARLGHLNRVGAKVGQVEIVQQQAAVGVRVGAHAPMPLGWQVAELLDEGALVVEELLGPVAAQPRFEQRKVLGNVSGCADGDLMGAEGALDGLVVDLLRPRPAFGCAQNDHRPARARGVVALARLLLDGLDALDHFVEHGGHALVNLRRVVAVHEVRGVAVAFEQRAQLVLRDASQHRGAGDLVAVEVQNGQHGAVANWVE